MVESVSEKKWDLVKIICVQPFNTRKQFGIAFITLYTPDEVKEEKIQPKAMSVPIQKEKSSPSSSKATKKIGKFAFRDSSEDEDDPEQLSPFKKWQIKKESPKSDLKTQMKSKLNDSRKRIRSTSGSSTDGEKKAFKPKAKLENRNRSKGLMYESDDDVPNERLQKKIDKDRKIEEPKSSLKSQPKSPTNKFASFISDSNPSTSKTSLPQAPKMSNLKKSPAPKKKKEPQYKPFDKLLEGVVFVMSGYQNPERGILRQKALDLGARYKGDWDNTCTHLM